ncbi:precorrin-3B C(17)-methyltransferase [Amycolatopsis sp. A133]|uniref:SecDF P1 head subdomain-containing protein n=1 Tax=Amycolatopsis sp. A133 TaxID=3064472 RepID=UPI0027F8B4BF|nr:precorrin-3B C(17)-methyltransferase [Amycolatopsis sp. A133]MDQ7802785.1 precorrin-3B C(17)-methyltransferase [Amycolatopsis sp. A133]
MRILLAAVALLAAAAGCQGDVSGRAHASRDGFVVEDGTRLRFRPVLGELPPGPAVGAPGQRQSTNAATQEAAARALDCSPGVPDALDGRDDPALPLVGCDRGEGTRYLLGPGFLSGADVGWVEARVDPATGSAVVNLTFTAAGARAWAEWTGRNVGKQVAMVVKSQVLTAPQIQAAITDGATQITGKFTLPEARQLARDIAGG